MSRFFAGILISAVMAVPVIDDIVCAPAANDRPIQRATPPTQHATRKAVLRTAVRIACGGVGRASVRSVEPCGVITWEAPSGAQVMPTS